MTKLARYLNRNGLHPRDFAAAVGCDRSTIIRVASGRQVPRPPLLRRIVAATNGEVSVEDLVTVAKDEDAA